MVSFIIIYISMTRSQSHASPVHEGVLQHEDTKSVWNELSQYKTNVTDLRKRL